MKYYFLTILLILLAPVYAFENQKERIFECITLNSAFKPDGGSFNVHVPVSGYKEEPAQAITKIKGNEFLKRFQAEAPAAAILCKNGDNICGFALNLESKDGTWIEMSSLINLGKDTSSIIRPSGFFYKIRSLVMKDIAEKELLEAETNDHKIGHAFHFEQATGLDKAKRTVAMRIQCGIKKNGSD